MKQGEIDHHIVIKMQKKLMNVIHAIFYSYMNKRFIVFSLVIAKVFIAKKWIKIDNM